MMQHGNTWYKSYCQDDNDSKEMKSKLYLRILCRPVSCKACSFTVFCQKICPTHTKKTTIVTPGWTDISGPGPASFLSRSSMPDMYCSMLILHDPIKPLNFIFWASNFTSPTTSCTNKLRRLELVQLTMSIKTHLFSYHLSRVNK